VKDLNERYKYLEKCLHSKMQSPAYALKDAKMDQVSNLGDIRSAIIAMHNDRCEFAAIRHIVAS